MWHPTDSTPTPQLDWVGPITFARRHPGPPGIDVDLGHDWGPRGDQRISWRHDPDGTVGLLYAYDPLWDEFAVLATDMARGVVEHAYRLVARDPRVATVEAFAALARRLVLTPMPRIEPAGLEPQL